MNKWLCIGLVLSLSAPASAHGELHLKGKRLNDREFTLALMVSAPERAPADRSEYESALEKAIEVERDPIRTVIRLFAAFEDRDAKGWVREMSSDYHFDSDDPSFVSQHPNGFTREDEAAFVTRLFVGGGRRPDGGALPIATRVEAPLGSVWVEVRDITSTRAIAHVERHAYTLSLADGSKMMLAGSDNVLELGLESDQWRVRAWHERVDAAAAVAAAPAAAPAGEPDAAAVALPVRLALRRLGGVASSTLEFELALPASGGALELFDVMGRRIAHRDLTDIAAGMRRVEIPSVGVPAGTYWARVQQAGSVATARVVRVR